MKSVRSDRGRIGDETAEGNEESLRGGSRGGSSIGPDRNGRICRLNGRWRMLLGIENVHDETNITVDRPRIVLTSPLRRANGSCRRFGSLRRDEYTLRFRAASGKQIPSQHSIHLRIIYGCMVYSGISAPSETGTNCGYAIGDISSESTDSMAGEIKSDVPLDSTIFGGWGNQICVPHASPRKHASSLVHERRDRSG
jgi:hypothetical protein